MPTYTVKNEATGRVIDFDWTDPNPPTDQDMEEIFAEAETYQPSFKPVTADTSTLPSETTQQIYQQGPEVDVGKFASGTHAQMIQAGLVNPIKAVSNIIAPKEYPQWEGGPDVSRETAKHLEENQLVTANPVTKFIEEHIDPVFALEPAEQEAIKNAGLPGTVINTAAIMLAQAPQFMLGGIGTAAAFGALAKAVGPAAIKAALPTVMRIMSNKYGAKAVQSMITNAGSMGLVEAGTTIAEGVEPEEAAKRIFGATTLGAMTGPAVAAAGKIASGVVKKLPEASQKAAIFGTEMATSGAVGAAGMPLMGQETDAKSNIANFITFALMHGVGSIPHATPKSREFIARKTAGQKPPMTPEEAGEIASRIVAGMSDAEIADIHPDIALSIIEKSRPQQPETPAAKTLVPTPEKAPTQPIEPSNVDAIRDFQNQLYGNVGEITPPVSPGVPIKTAKDIGLENSELVQPQDAVVPSEPIKPMSREEAKLAIGIQPAPSEIQQPAAKQELPPLSSLMVSAEYVNEATAIAKKLGLIYDGIQDVPVKNPNGSFSLKPKIQITDKNGITFNVDSPDQIEARYNEKKQQFKIVEDKVAEVKDNSSESPSVNKADKAVEAFIKSSGIDISTIEPMNDAELLNVTKAVVREAKDEGASPKQLGRMQGLVDLLNDEVMRLPTRQVFVIAMNKLGKSDRNAVLYSLDINNMGGLNAFFEGKIPDINSKYFNEAWAKDHDFVTETGATLSGHEAANVVLKKMGQIVNDKMKSESSTTNRIGGDEINGIDLSRTPQQVHDLLKTASTEINEYLKSLGINKDLGGIGHPKNDYFPTGSGIDFGVAQYKPGMDIWKVLGDAEHKAADRKDQLLVDLLKITVDENGNPLYIRSTRKDDQGKIRRNPNVNGNAIEKVGSGQGISGGTVEPVGTPRFGIGDTRRNGDSQQTPSSVGNTPEVVAPPTPPVPSATSPQPPTPPTPPTPPAVSPAAPTAPQPSNRAALAASAHQKHVENNEKVKAYFTKDAKQYIADLKRAFVDIGASWKDALNKLYKPEAWSIIKEHNLMRGASGAAADVLESSKKRIYKSTDFDMKDYETLAEWRINRRLIEVTDLKKSQGIDYKSYGGKTREEAQAWLDEFAASNPQKQKTFEEINRIVNEEISEKPLNRLVEEGLLTPQERDRLIAEHANYNPIKFIQHIDPQGQVISKGKTATSVHDSGIKALDQGSENAMITNPDVLLAEVIARTESRIAKNRANRALIEFAERNPDNALDVKIVEPTGTDKYGKSTYPDAPAGMDRIEGFYKDGTRRAVFVPEKMAKDWQAYDPVISDGVAKYLDWFSGTKPFKMAATGYNPSFLVSNVPMDIMHIWGSTPDYSPILPKYLSEISEDIAHVLANFKELEHQYIREGGTMEFLSQQGQLKFSKPQTSAVGKVAKGIEETAGWAPYMSEMTLRLAHRQRVLKNLEPDIKSGKITLEEAQREATARARDRLDYSQGGNYAKAADKVIPFFNAAIQGSRGILRQFADPETRAQATLKAAQVAYLGFVTSYWGNRIHPQAMDEVSDQIKAANFVIPMWTPEPYIDENGNKRYLYYTVKKDQGQAIFAILGELAGEYAATGKMPSADRIGYALGNIAPADLKFALEIPTVSALLAMYNKKMTPTGFRDIWSGLPVSPSKEVKAETPPEWEAIGKATEGLPKGIQISPVRMKEASNAIIPETNFFAVAMGSVVRKIFEEMPEGKEKEKAKKSFMQQVPQIPIANRFLRETKPQPEFKQKMLELSKRLGIEATEETPIKELKKDVAKAETKQADIKQENNLKFQRLALNAKSGDETAKTELKDGLSSLYDTDPDEYRRVIGSLKRKYPNQVVDLTIVNTIKSPRTFEDIKEIRKWYDNASEESIREVAARLGGDIKPLAKRLKQYASPPDWFTAKIKRLISDRKKGILNQADYEQKFSELMNQLNEEKQ